MTFMPQYVIKVAVLVSVSEPTTVFKYQQNDK